MMETLQRLRFGGREMGWYSVGALTAVSLISLLRYRESGRRTARPAIFQAPREHTSTASSYPPDAIPGARDVNTPYGSIRVYEWGPREGRRVLFVHGISTPCISLATLAEELVGHGCRVMLFDLPGRGYSDTTDPSIHRQDTGLFSAQILAVLASAEVNWLHDGFTIVGYSLGGGIAAQFTYFFPQLVDSLVMIAGSGIMRHSRISWSSRLLYGHLLPEWLVHRWVRQRITAGSDVPRLRKGPKRTDDQIDITDAVEEELPAQESDKTLFAGRPSFDLNGSVIWQTMQHPGFVPAFVSSIQYAPIHDGHKQWRVIGQRCAERRLGLEQDPCSKGLRETKALIILGSDDTVTLKDQTSEDALDTLGADNVTIKILKGGHDLQTTNSRGCAKAILQHWSSVL